MTSEEMKKHLDEIIDELSTFRTLNVVGSRMSSRQRLGPFRSFRNVPTGTEISDSRPFTLDDDPAGIDWRRFPVEGCLNFIMQIVNERVLMRRFTYFAESEFILVVDLSRSMLTDCIFGQNDSSSTSGGLKKVRALFTAVTAFLTVAEAAGYHVRLLMLSNGRVAEQKRYVNPRGCALQAMWLMAALLLETLDKWQEKPDIEPFCLATGIEEALEVQFRSAIVLVSDFLEPIDKRLENRFAEAMVRHETHLVDVAHTWEAEFPVPGFWDFDMARAPTLLGPWYAEEVISPRRALPGVVHNWNKERAIQKNWLNDMCQASGSRLHDYRKISHQEAIAEALATFQYGG